MFWEDYVGDVECYLIIALPTHFIIMHSKKSSALTLPPTQKKNIKLEFHPSYIYFTGNVHMWIDAEISNFLVYVTHRPMSQ